MLFCVFSGLYPVAPPAGPRDGTLPEERAQRCPEEYGQTRAAWQKLLLPYLKE
jgi:hypothetical protein